MDTTIDVMLEDFAAAEHYVNKVIDLIGDYSYEDVYRLTEGEDTSLSNYAKVTIWDMWYNIKNYEQNRAN